MAHYVDTSALVKLVVAEAGSAALRRWIDVAAPDLVSSDLARTELLRAVRSAAPERVLQARAVLDSLTILTLGLFALVVNAVLLLLAAEVAPGFDIDTFHAQARGARR